MQQRRRERLDDAPPLPRVPAAVRGDLRRRLLWEHCARLGASVLAHHHGKERTVSDTPKCPLCGKQLDHVTVNPRTIDAEAYWLCPLYDGCGARFVVAVGTRLDTEENNG